MPNKLETLNIADYIENDYNNRKVLDWYFFSNLRENKFWDLLDLKYLRINLRGVDLFKTDGITWLLDILFRRKLLGYYSLIVLPEEFSHLSFLSQVGFLNYQWLFNYQFENEYLIHNQNFSQPNPLSKIFLIDNDYFYRISSYISGIEKYLAKKRNIELKKFESRGIDETFGHFMEEWAINISTHGIPRDEKYEKNDPCILGLLSVSLKVKEYPWIRIVFSDIGQGLYTTLLQREDKSRYLNGCKSAKDAIFTAIMYRKNYVKERVLGIYYTLGFIERNNGFFSIRNDDRFVQLNLAGEPQKNKFLSKYQQESADYDWIMGLADKSDLVLPRIHGTQICIDLLFDGESDAHN